jgi:hypothetical protein
MPYGAFGLTVTAPPAGPLLVPDGELLAVEVGVAAAPSSEADTDWAVAPPEARLDGLADAVPDCSPAWLAGFGAG